MSEQPRSFLGAGKAFLSAPTCPWSCTAWSHTLGIRGAETGFGIEGLLSWGFRPSGSLCRQRGPGGRGPGGRGPGVKKQGSRWLTDTHRAPIGTRARSSVRVTPEDLVFHQDENLVGQGGEEGSGETLLPGALSES